MSTTATNPASTRKTNPGSGRPLVLFDGACPLCRREIRHYRRLRGAEHVDWLDIAAQPGDVEALGVSVAQAMAVLHVRDAQGRWCRGAYAFAELWIHLRGYRLLARLLLTAHLLRPLDALYRVFARWRLKRRCSADSGCGVPKRDARRAMADSRTRA